MTPCKIWTGSTNSAGYGYVYVPGEGMKLAHRVAWEESHGPIPPGLFVCHRCDTPLCYEVEHLFLGTHSDNMRDCYEKGRSQGTFESKLTEDDVREIRRLYATGEWTQRQLGERFGVHFSNISAIVLGKSWTRLA